MKGSSYTLNLVVERSGHRHDQRAGRSIGVTACTSGRGQSVERDAYLRRRRTIKNYTISATATDEDGTYASNNLVVSVNNVAPTADAGGPYTVGEGGTVLLNGWR